MNNWQILDTAPKDGTRVLFFYGLYNAIFTAWYEDRRWWLVNPTDEDFCSFFDYDPINCYWQPMMELPV